MGSKGLGRVVKTDLRDANHLMREILQADKRAVPEFKVWEHGQILDQGEEGACVGFGWTAWENSKPIGFKQQQGNDYGFTWYNRAKQIDAWPGTDYSGTSVRAGAKVAMERGFIERYLWAGSIEEVRSWLLTRGPLVLGTPWYKSMDRLASNAFATVNPAGGVRGGHCYLLLGVGQKGNYVCQNSWGEGYGDGGLFYMTPANFANLINAGDAEFCTALQTTAAV